MNNPFHFFLNNTIHTKWKIRSVNEYCCQIQDIQKNNNVKMGFCAKICLKTFDEYPQLKTNVWSWGGEDLVTKKLKHLTQNASRRSIGAIESIWSDEQPLSIEMKTLLFDVTRSIAKNLGYRVLIVPMEFAHFFENLQHINPRGMKRSSYSVYIPGSALGGDKTSEKSQMIRMEEINSKYIKGGNNRLGDIEDFVNQFTKKKNVRIFKLTKTDPSVSAKKFQKYCKSLCIYSKLFDTKREEEDADGFFVTRGEKKEHILGMGLYAPFNKNDYPPPLTKNGYLDDADPVFFFAAQNITEKICRGYSLHLVCIDETIAKILLARILTELRKVHGRVVTVIVENPNTFFKSLTPNFEVIQARFPVRYAMQGESDTWKTQMKADDKIEEPIWMSRMVNASKNLITLDIVQKWLG